MRNIDSNADNILFVFAGVSVGVCHGHDGLGLDPAYTEKTPPTDNFSMTPSVDNFSMQTRKTN